MDKYLKANIVFSKFSRQYMDIKKDLPIRPSEMGVLNIIVRRGGLYTPIMIAELLEVTKPMATNHISVLLKKGYVKKQYLENDKRSFYVIPTDKAKILVETTEKKLKDKLLKVETELGKGEFDKLVMYLDKVRTLFND